MNNIHLIVTAIGVTVGVISAASIFIYRKISIKQQHTAIVSNLDSANKKIAELQAELEALRYHYLNLRIYINRLKNHMYYI